MPEKERKLQQSAAIPFLKISHRYLVQYWHVYYEQERFKSIFANFFGEDGLNITYAGDMSKGAVKRLQNACELLIAITPKKSFISKKTGKKIIYRIGFITLTLSAPQMQITDREIKEKMLAPFIRKLKKYGLRNYIWKAERQGNGNIHFHVFVDCFIPKEDVTNIWNRLQSNFHFINAFCAKFGHRDPPSTNIKCVVSDSGLVKYMLKYMLKPVNKGQQTELGRATEKGATGKVWDCSEALKTENDTAAEVSAGEYQLLQELVDSGDLEVSERDHATIFYYTNENSFKHLPDSLKLRYDNFLDKVIGKSG